MEDYFTKYLKYKLKYFNEKKQVKGGADNSKPMSLELITFEKIKQDSRYTEDKLNNCTIWLSGYYLLVILYPNNKTQLTLLHVNPNQVIKGKLYSKMQFSMPIYNSSKTKIVNLTENQKNYKEGEYLFKINDVEVNYFSTIDNDTFNSTYNNSLKALFKDYDGVKDIIDAQNETPGVSNLGNHHDRSSDDPARS